MTSIGGDRQYGFSGLAPSALDTQNKLEQSLFNLLKKNGINQTDFSNSFSIDATKCSPAFINELDKFLNSLPSVINNDGASKEVIFLFLDRLSSIANKSGNENDKKCADALKAYFGGNFQIGSISPSSLSGASYIPTDQNSVKYNPTLTENMSFNNCSKEITDLLSKYTGRVFNSGINISQLLFDMSNIKRTPGDEELIKFISENHELIGSLTFKTSGNSVNLSVSVNTSVTGLLPDFTNCSDQLIRGINNLFNQLDLKPDNNGNIKIRPSQLSSFRTQVEKLIDKNNPNEVKLLNFLLSNEFQFTGNINISQNTISLLDRNGNRINQPLGILPIFTPSQVKFNTPQNIGTSTTQTASSNTPILNISVGAGISGVGANLTGVNYNTAIGLTVPDSGKLDLSYSYNQSFQSQDPSHKFKLTWNNK